ncbi:hypothetical protein VF14_31840 [Nostoc linckia z18]|uniref:Uncharacterized protein n=2 Tax=Nostoc linckia TaxID=92942 RepID=A0A9Q6EHZ7_NOSLI|nr:ATP-binding protein [Nostoc linckia]PHK34617.1 hypothetical protein VF12_23590 [Nostoc linckia z15]PHK41180.1 hypothetical protein VF13_31695 [Nostoc linckia z16]PHJ55788.1 hypothetical protein VF02_35455 [Nostoc linckia z1]PHJ57002.1 hypothetical protein VF05_36475 [Nostoc linckia z3]PHJ58296.1 hypothetical protein VF03_35660 [Nostoc linckia z2]
MVQNNIVSDEDLAKASKSLRFKKSLKYGLLTSFTCLSLSPLVLKNYTDENTKQFLLWSGFVSGLLGGVPINWEREQNLLKTFESVNKETFKRQISGEIVLGDLTVEANNLTKIVNFVERLPFNIQDHFARKLRVEDYLTSNFIEPESQPVEPKPGIQLEENHLWIKSILKEPFKILTGEQGSGKSTFERLLIDLLREQGHHIIILNPETIRQGANDVTVMHKIEEINAFLEKFPQSIERRQQQARNLRIDEDDYLEYLEENEHGLKGRVAIFLMEANTYEAHGVNPELWATFLKQMSTNIRKWGFTAVLTAHSPNQTSISSKLKGFSALLDSAVHIECLATTNGKGEKIGSGKALIKKGKQGESKTVDLPFYKPKSKHY